MLTYPEELLSEQELNLRREVARFVKWVPRQVIVGKEAERVP